MTEKAPIIEEPSTSETSPEAHESVEEPKPEESKAEAPKSPLQAEAVQTIEQDLEKRKTEVGELIDKNGDNKPKVKEPVIAVSPTVAAAKASSGSPGLVTKLFKGLWGVAIIGGGFFKDLFIDLMPKSVQDMLVKKEKKADGKK